MTKITTTAGQIDHEWLTNASYNATNHTEIEEWFCHVLNSNDIDIDDDGAVYDYDRQHWLSQDEIDDACARIDRGI